MADNANATAGDGSVVVAADDIGGVKYQRVKLSIGADGTAADMDSGAGTGGSATPRVIIDSSQVDSVAAGATDSGTPPKIGAVAAAGLSANTPVSGGQRTNVFADIDGALIVHPHCALEDIVTGHVTNTDGTATQLIAAQAAGIKTYLTSIVFANSSASNLTVDIKDGSTIKLTFPVPANSGCVFNPPVPLPGSAATAWNFQGSAAATTLTVSAIGFKSKV